jgi:hypothetical protein
VTAEGWLLSANLLAVMALLVVGIWRNPDPGSPIALERAAWQQPAPPEPPEPAALLPGYPPAVPVVIDPEEGEHTYRRVWLTLPPSIRHDFPTPTRRPPR